MAFIRGLTICLTLRYTFRIIALFPSGAINNLTVPNSMKIKQQIKARETLVYFKAYHIHASIYFKFGNWKVYFTGSAGHRVCVCYFACESFYDGYKMLPTKKLTRSLIPPQTSFDFWLQRNVMSHRKVFCLSVRTSLSLIDFNKNG